jgi:cytochrome c peroxidase
MANKDDRENIGLPFSFGVVITLAILAIVSGCPFSKSKSAEPERDREAVLGSILFEEPTLSANGKVACVTCHVPEHGYTSGGLPLGLDGRPLTRRAPTVLNRADGKRFFWDGRATSLKEQAASVLTNRREMGNRSVADVADRLNRSGYRKTFEVVYGEPATADSVVRAIVAFERTLRTAPGRFDSYLAGEPDALTPQQARGAAIFVGKGLCYKCHGGPNLTGDDLQVTGVSGDAGRFKVPPLRHVARMAPYMHDGSLKTLGEVVDYYDRHLSAALSRGRLGMKGTSLYARR